jgi:hypothetical protein
MSASLRKRTHSGPLVSARRRPEQVQHKLRLLDHLVGAAEQRKRPRASSQDRCKKMQRQVPL